MLKFSSPAIISVPVVMILVMPIQIQPIVVSMPPTTSPSENTGVDICLLIVCSLLSQSIIFTYNSSLYSYQVDLYIEIDQGFVDNHGSMDAAITYVNVLVTAISSIYEEEVSYHSELDILVPFDVFTSASKTPAFALALCSTHRLIHISTYSTLHSPSYTTLSLTPKKQLT